MSKSYYKDTLKSKDARLVLTLPADVKAEWVEMCRDFTGKDRKSGVILYHLMLLFLKKDFNAIKELSNQIEAELR